jgi:hypothetical protein
MKSKRFRCFNGGCFASSSLENFVLKFSSEYGLDLSNIDLTDIKSEETDNTHFNNLIITKDNNIYDYIDDMDLLNKLPHIDELKYIFGLKDIYEIDINSKIYKFLDNRGAFSIPLLNKRIFADNFDSCIYIMNLDDLTNRVLSYSTRSISKKHYNIQVYSDFFKIWNPPCEIEEEYIEFLDMISSYYNILNVDFTKEVNITEGQFDAMFLDNYMALQGVSKISFILNHIKSEQINILFDMDDAGYSSVTKIMKGYGVFLWTLIIDSLKRNFYNETYEISKIHDINELFKFLYFKSNKTLDLHTFNVLIKKYTSRNQYDHFFI